METESAMVGVFGLVCGLFVFKKKKKRKRKKRG
jgi:hypothetical protein